MEEGLDVHIVLLADDGVCEARKINIPSLEFVRWFSPSFIDHSVNRPTPVSMSSSDEVRSMANPDETYVTSPTVGH